MSLSPGGLFSATSASVLTVAAPALAASHQFHADDVLGTSLDIVVVGDSDHGATRAVEAVRAEIDRLDQLLSGWRDDSELARLNAAREPLVVSPDLFEVIAACEAWRAGCRGAFSGRLGVLEALWRSSERSGEAPDKDALASAAAWAEAGAVGLDPTTLAVARPDGVVFAVDALAKGYIIDKALEAARAASLGARGILVDIGGDLRCWGEGPAGAWRIGVARGFDPDNIRSHEAVAVRDKAVATSGPGPRDRAIGGRRYSHLLSPASGQAVDSTVTVVADRAADADAFATALAAMDPAEGLARAQALPGFEARIVSDDGRVRMTSGWDRLVYRPEVGPRLIRAAAARQPAAPATGEPPDFEVKVDLNLLPAKGPGANYRPFVVVWISEPSGKLIRTVSLWGDRRGYVGENRIWWRSFLGKYESRDVDRFSRPSRPAGAYSVVWDGRNDYGIVVKPGQYLVHVEYVREGGPHLYQSMPLTIGAAPAAVSAPADDELGLSKVTYSGQVRATTRAPVSSQPATKAPTAGPRAPAR